MGGHGEQKINKEQRNKIKLIIKKAKQKAWVEDRWKQTIHITIIIHEQHEE